MTPLLPRGIQARLFLLIALALFPMILLQGWIYFARYQTRRAQAIETELEVAQGVAATIAAYIEDIHHTSGVVGEAIVTFRLYSEAQVTRILAFTADQDRSVRNLSWASTAGTVLASSDPALVGRSLAGRLYFREVLGGRSWFIGEITREGIATPRATFAIATAIRDDATLPGVTVAGIEPDFLDERILQRPTQGAFSIFDMHGNVAFRSEGPPMTWEERIGWKESDALLRRALETGVPQYGAVRLEVPGGDWFSARVPIPETGWVAGAGRPIGVALAPVRQRLFYDITLVVLLASAAFSLTWFLARTISSSLQALEADARAMGAGRIVSRPDARAPQEVARLRQTVETMATGLLSRAEEIRQSEERYRLVNLATNDVIWDWDLRTDEFLWNQSLESVFGYSLDEVLKEVGWWYDHLDPEDHDRVVATIHAAINGGGDFWSSEYRFRNKDGSWATVFDRGHIQRDEKGEAVRMVGSMLDLTERLRQEEALRRSEAQFRHLADALPQLVWITRPDGYHEYFNRRWHEFTGTTLGDTKGDLWATLLHPDDYQRSVARWQQSLESGAPYQIEYRFRRARDGAYRWFLGQALPVRDEQGDIVRWFGTCTDIQDLKEAEEALRAGEERYRTLFERMGEGFALGEPILDIKGDAVDFRYLEINTAFEQLTGLRRDEVLGKPMREIDPDLEQHWVDSFGGVALSGREIRFENYNRFTHRYFDVFCYSPSQGRFAILFRDVTERTEAEEALRRLKDELEIRVQERTAELTTANRELEAFTYSVSHDLRAPLRHIASFAEILDTTAGPALDEKGRRYIGIISEAARRMGALIDDLLTFSRIGRAAMKDLPVSLKHLVEESRRELAPETEGRTIEWRIGRLPQVQGDPVLLKTVVTNLLSNALKYTRHREKSVIEIGSREEGDETVVWVRDNGAGFDMRYADKLFGVFQRLHKAEEFEGTGIGLASVKRIVERHGGRVWAEGETDRGAVFYFSLPHERRDPQGMP
jgi:PAS domain S-box-containing protein